MFHKWGCLFLLKDRQFFFNNLQFYRSNFRYRRNVNSRIVKNNRLLMMLIIASVILLIPVFTMLYSSKVNWTLFDFVIAGTLLFLTVLSFEFVFRFLQPRRTRLIALSILIILLALIWIELSVGLVGSPFAGN